MLRCVSGEFSWNGSELVVISGDQSKKSDSEFFAEN